MKLTARCTYCKEDIIIKSSAATRPDLQMEKGEEFKVACSHCGRVNVIHVNDVSAEVDNRIILIGILLGIIVTVVLWNMFGAIGTVSMGVPVMFWYQQMNAVRGFNSYRIRRK